MLVTCAECQKPNTLDSQFCRSCGHSLPADTLAQARADNEQLVTDGFKLLSESRYDEARLVAEEALQADPSHGQALSLKADALERMGDLAGAITAYERVVALMPDSALDRIKLEHVRRIVAQEAAAPPKPNRKLALGAALASTLLIACLGTAIAIVMNSRNTTNVGALTDSTGMTGGATMVGDANPSSAIPQAREISREEYERLLRESQAQAQQQANVTPQGSPQPNVPPTNAGGQLPNPRTNGQMEPLTGDVRPMTPPMNLTPINGESRPAPQPSQPTNDPSPATSTSNDPEPTPAGGNPGPRRSPAGTVDIRPSDGQSPSIGGSQPIADPGTMARDQVSRGRQFMTTGDYAKAAEAFERALAAGADPGSTNQRLGQCYQELGRKADAIRAYENAARVFAARLQANPNNDAARSALEVCNKAISLLRS